MSQDSAHFGVQWTTCLAVLGIYIQCFSSSQSYKTMTAQEVANAMNDKQMCSPTIIDDTCISPELMDSKEWDGIRKLKDGIISKFNKSICVTPCTRTLPNNKTVETCGPFYFYLTTFSVLPGQVKKSEFAEKFGRDLLSALNNDEENRKDKRCDGVFLFFFSRVDRLIALRAPYASYLYDYQQDIYQGVKGYYTKAMDEMGFSFDQAVFDTFQTIDNCLKKQDRFCAENPCRKKQFKPFSIILFIIGCALIMGLVISSIIWGKKGSEIDNGTVQRKVRSVSRSSISSKSCSSCSSRPPSDHENEGRYGGDC